MYSDVFSIGCKEWAQTGPVSTFGAIDLEQQSPNNRYEGRGYVYLGRLLIGLQGMGSTGSCFDVGAI